MKKIFLVLALVGLVFSVQLSTTQAVVDDSIYSLGFGSTNSNGSWREMPDQVSFFLGCPNGYSGNKDGSGMITGNFGIEGRKIYYCWLPQFDEIQYTVRALGRAIYGGILPLEQNPSGLTYITGTKEVAPEYETFSWTTQYWNQSVGQLAKKTTSVSGTFYDALFEDINDVAAAQNAAADALEANGFVQTPFNSVPANVSYYRGFEKKADDLNKTVACKITQKSIPGSQSKFLKYFKKKKSFYFGGGSTGESQFGDPNAVYYSVRVSCGYFQK